MMPSSNSPQIDRSANSIRRGAPRLVMAALAAALGLWLQLGGQRDSQAQRAPSDPARVVRVQAVHAAPEHRLARFTGVFRARQRAQLAFTMGGRLIRRPAQIGQRVKQGDLLAQLDPAPLRLARDGARAQLADVQARHDQLARDLVRITRLVEQKSAAAEAQEKTRSALEATGAARDGLVARLAEAERQLMEARLTAPFDGTVLEVGLQPGETAAAGRLIVVLSAEDQLEVEVHVPESVRAGLSPEAKVQVNLPMADMPALGGQIMQLGRAASGPGSLFPVIVGLDGPAEGVVPGFTAEVVLPVRRAGGLLVAVPAVADPGGHAPFVYRVKDGRAERVPVKVLGLLEGEVLVQSGLRLGDEVITQGHASLLPGEAVQVQR